MLIPLDVKRAWVDILSTTRTAVNSHEGELITILVLCIGGEPKTAFLGHCAKLEPKTIATSEAGFNNWWNVIRRLQSIAKNKNGLLSISIALNGDGIPVWWSSPGYYPVLV